MDDLLAPFSDPVAAARYADGPVRFVPGLADLHRMAILLLAERSPEDARILVLGAGGGLELKAFAEARPGWSFDGVDPALAMLEQASRTLGPLARRVRLHQGYIHDAPRGPFDAATCLLTLHFLAPKARLETLKALRQRLRPGAPFVAAHSSFPQVEPQRRTWLARYAAFAVAAGVDPRDAERARDMVERGLEALPPEQDEALMREAGFSNVNLFYAAFTWRGWVAEA
ncbi:MAG TPA: methyltransferase [Caulobacteraceae bacterium]|nr:methyltransferase [Caulobacteraceae bacterium]